MHFTSTVLVSLVAIAATTLAAPVGFDDDILMARGEE
jgi:hypothetical protein